MNLSLVGRLRNLLPSNQKVLFVCIGTDRSTGDSLGPLVGTKLSDAGYEVLGTLDDPVHAVNLEQKLEHIGNYFSDRFIIAIDACLGQFSNVGNIKVACGSIKPGAGVKKDLPAVGHASITGIVNVGGFMEYFVLQNTRLSLVMRLADEIASTCMSAVSKRTMKKKRSKARGCRHEPTSA